MKYTKALASGTIIWFILFVADWLIELFQMTETGERVTLFGMKLTVYMAKDELITTFQPTWRALMSYLTVVFVILVVTLIAQRKKANDTK